MLQSQIVTFIYFYIFEFPAITTAEVRVPEFVNPIVITPSYDYCIHVSMSL